MEKTTVLALATGQKQFSAALCKLVEKYAEILASQGLLGTAMEYLKLMGSEELSPELAVLRGRIALSIEQGSLLCSLHVWYRYFSYDLLPFGVCIPLCWTILQRIFSSGLFVEHLVQIVLMNSVWGLVWNPNILRRPGLSSGKIFYHV